MHDIAKFINDRLCSEKITGTYFFHISLLCRKFKTVLYRDNNTSRNKKKDRGKGGNRGLKRKKNKKGFLMKNHRLVFTNNNPFRLF